MFVQLYATGGKVPPIEIYQGTTEIRAGFHRRAALKKLDWEDRELEFKIAAEPKDYTEKVVDAYADNVGGSQPPTVADAVYVIRALLEKKVKSKHILKVFTKRLGKTYTEKMLNGFVRAAKAQITDEKIHAALTDITQKQMTVPDAAVKHGVDLKKLKARIAPKRKATGFDVDNAKKQLSGYAIGHSRKVRAIIDDVLDKHASGSANAEDVLEIIAHVDQLNVRSADAMIRARRRLEKAGGPKSADKAERKAGRRTRSRNWASRGNARRTHRNRKARRTVSKKAATA